MQALILAAGRGRRLGDYTTDKPKCMIELNGHPLIYRMVSQLIDNKVEKIIVVVGYQADALRSYLTESFPGFCFEFIDNKEYLTTNNIYSLWLARKHMSDDDTLLLESDLVLENSVLASVIRSGGNAVAVVSKFKSWMDGTVVKLNSDSFVTEFITQRFSKQSESDVTYKTVNIYMFRKEFINSLFIPALDIYVDSFGKNDYYEEVLRVITENQNMSIYGEIIDNSAWYEIDNEHDYRAARQMFAVQ